MPGSGPDGWLISDRDAFDPPAPYSVRTESHQSLHGAVRQFGAFAAAFAAIPLGVTPRRCTHCGVGDHPHRTLVQPCRMLPRPTHESILHMR